MVRDNTELLTNALSEKQLLWCIELDVDGGLHRHPLVSNIQFHLPIKSECPMVIGLRHLVWRLQVALLQMSDCCYKCKQLSSNYSDFSRFYYSSRLDPSTNTLANYCWLPLCSILNCLTPSSPLFEPYDESRREVTGGATEGRPCSIV